MVSINYVKTDCERGRERDSTLQIRIYIHDIYDLVNDLCLERKKWKSVINKYGQFKHDSISYRKVLSWLFSAPVIFVLCAIIILFLCPVHNKYLQSILAILN